MRSPMPASSRRRCGRGRRLARARSSRLQARSMRAVHVMGLGDSFPLTEALGEALAAPAYVGNDVQVATDAEFALGAGKDVSVGARSVLGHRGWRRHRAGRQAVDGPRVRRGDRPHGRPRGRSPLSMRPPRLHGGLCWTRRDGSPRPARGQARQAHRAVRDHGGARAGSAHQRRVGARAGQGRSARDSAHEPGHTRARHRRGVGAERTGRRGGRDRRRAGGPARARCTSTASRPR